MTDTNANWVEQTKANAEARLEELQPFLEEADQLQAVLGALTGRRPRGTSATAATRAQRGERPQEFVAIVAEHGAAGISIPEIRGHFGEDPGPYVYNIAKKAVEDGKVRAEKDGNTTMYFPLEDQDEDESTPSE